MKPLTAILLAIPTSVLGGVCLLGILRTEFGPPAPNNAPPIIVEEQKHTATAAMRANSAALETKAAPSFRAEADDGQTYALADLAQEVDLLQGVAGTGNPHLRLRNPVKPERPGVGSGTPEGEWVAVAGAITGRA